MNKTHAKVRHTKDKSHWPAQREIVFLPDMPCCSVPCLSVVCMYMCTHEPAWDHLCVSVCVYLCSEGSSQALPVNQEGGVRRWRSVLEIFTWPGLEVKGRGVPELKKWTTGWWWGRGFGVVWLSLMQRVWRCRQTGSRSHSKRLSHNSISAFWLSLWALSYYGLLLYSNQKHSLMDKLYLKSKNATWHDLGWRSTAV